MVSAALLSSNVYAANFNLYSNGNPVTDYNNVEEGILSAVYNTDKNTIQGGTYYETEE